MKLYRILFLSIYMLVACNAINISRHESDQNTGYPSLVTENSILPDLGEAPELTNEVWINTSEPLRLANLQGKVILLEMWTFG